MSGRRGWEQPARTPSWVYALVGVLLTLVVVLVVVILLGLGNGNGSPGLASATATPTSPAGSVAPTDSGAPASAAVTPEITAAPTPEITPAPTPAPTAAPTPAVTPAPGTTGSPAPSGSVKPTIVSMTIQHTADCHKDYGYGSAGFIKISWVSMGTTGVRISVDPPDAATAYGYGYKDEPSSGTDWVPFTCGPTSHLYVVTTLHTTGYYQYRYAKVTQSPLPSATP